MRTPLRVLMVEDSDEDTELVIRELRRGGYDVSFERVDTPQAMSASLDNRTWDVVICNFSLPHFGGPDALRLLRGSNPDTPFIYVSALIGEDAAVAALKQGAHDYVMKGSLKRLLPAIQRELKEAEQRFEKAQLERQRRHQERFESIGRLAGGIAHDFNNLIGAITGWAELGQDEARNGSGLQDRFRQIRNQAERAAGLTSQLLAFARCQVLKPVKLDVNKSISEMHSFLASRMEENIEFKIILDPHLDVIQGDASQFGQIVMNLCINARDAMPTGGRLIIETHNVGNRSGILPPKLRWPPRSLCDACDLRHRHWHGCRDGRPPLRAFLHHQRPRQRNRTWIGYCIWNCETAWRFLECMQ